MDQEKLKAISEKWQKELTPEELDETIRAMNRMAPGLIVDNVVQPCKKKQKTKSLRCVDPSSPAIFSPEVKDAIKKNAGGSGKDAKSVNVNYDQVAKWEGGNFGGGYVPWGPKVDKVTKDFGEKGKPRKVDVFIPSTEHDVDKDGKQGHLKGWKVGKYANSSGVTVGVGVDLGGKTEKGFGDELKAAAKESGLMTEAEAQKLTAKLKPYFGKKWTDGCQTLRTTPLTLTQAETDLINYSSFTSHTKTAIRQYEQSGNDWNDLSEEEQTFVLSTVYHKGSIKKEKAKAIGTHDADKVSLFTKGEREKPIWTNFIKPNQKKMQEKQRYQFQQLGDLPNQQVPLSRVCAIIFFCLLYMDLYLSIHQGFAQRLKPAKGQRFVPPIFGKWRVGQAVVVDAGGVLRPVTLLDSLDSGQTMLPAGLRVDFQTGYDSKAREVVSSMVLQPPFPPQSCKIQLTQFHCDSETGRAIPRNTPIEWEFALEMSKDEVFETFSCVGADAKAVSFVIHVNGHEWIGEFFVSKDRKTMWTPIFPGKAYFTNASGLQEQVAKTATMLQVYHRVVVE